jgi:ribokinase
MSKKILVVSSANMDMVLNVERVPDGGQTVIESGNYEYIPGGKGANSALAFARLGGDTTFLTKVGVDANGDALLDLYNREGINSSFIKRDKDAPTGLATIFVEKSGQNRIIVFAGANQKIDSESVDSALTHDYDALYMQFEINYDAIIYSAKKASEKGIPVFIDAGAIKRDFPFEKLPSVEIFSPNESEAFEITGIYPDTEENCLEVSKKIASLVKAKWTVIKLGGRGAYIFDGENGKVVPTFDTKVVDTTAAGDAFTAGLTLEYLRTNDIWRACDYANATGTLTVSKKGASSSIPSASEVEKFLEKVKG